MNTMKYWMGGLVCVALALGGTAASAEEISGAPVAVEDVRSTDNTLVIEGERQPAWDHRVRRPWQTTDGETAVRACGTQRAQWDNRRPRQWQQVANTDCGQPVAVTMDGERQPRWDHRVRRPWPTRGQ